MSKYDKTVAISHEEEGTYHRREYEHTPAKPVTTYERYTVPATTTSTRTTTLRRHGDTSGDSDNDNFEEWTTSKRKVNHKTRQVETRVSRQLLVEDGKVIADSGPQVTTRIKEDNKVEECEKEKTPKNKSKFEALENATESGESSGRVLGEKKEIQRVSREVREENLQYHDERFKELTGHDVHRKAIKAPHELITINDKNSGHDSAPRGKMVHYSNKGRKYQDTDEILEVAKLAIDGSITKEVKRTKHHEEFSEDEQPDEKGEAEALRNEPIATRSSRRHVDYVNDFDDTATPSASSDDEVHHSTTATRHKKQHSSKPHTQHRHRHHEDEAFPRYQIDPLLNSLRDEDFVKPKTGGRHVEHSLERRRNQDDDDDGDYHLSRSSRVVQTGGTRRMASSPSPASARGDATGPVEIPEEYRVNKSKLMSNKSHGRGHRSHREDAGVQARLTDEEVERRSMHSSSSGITNSHEKQARHLQRQSTANSSRNYYYGEKKHQKSANRQRKDSISSSSSSSLSDPKERMRQQGTRSRDSGFKSPHSSSGNQIYSVSSKSKRRGDGVASPTPTQGSLGQRSVKTTTTTMSAGLADRPLSRNTRSSEPEKPARSRSKQDRSAKNHVNYLSSSDEIQNNKQQVSGRTNNHSSSNNKPFDTISLSSLGPNATTIKVPYRQVAETGEQQHGKNNDKLRGREDKEAAATTTTTTSEMSFQEDIQSLSKRLDDIRRKPTESVIKTKANQDKQQFDYKTIIKNIQPVTMPKQQQVLDAYNVRVIEHKSPFIESNQQTLIELQQEKQQPQQQGNQVLINVTNNNNNNNNMNNNEASFNLNDYVKYRAIPVLVDSGSVINGGSSSSNMDYDRMSLGSSCSLQSSKTYNISTIDTKLPQKYQDQREIDNVEREEESTPTNKDDEEAATDETSGIVFDENGNSKRPTAWVFDPRDGSSTAIAAPARPKRPETPKLDSKTEELTQSRGGRSYYLELVDPGEKAGKRQRPSSIDSLYSRWNSHGALNNHAAFSENRYNSRQALASKASGLNLSAKHNSNDITKSRNTLNSFGAKNAKTTQLPKSTMNLQSPVVRRQLPFGGPPNLGNRSRSSSCLLTVTKPSKYSIYGGFRKPGENNKPVPRLSYSRAIGPKSQRQIDAQSKTPSRYLKMK